MSGILGHLKRLRARFREKRHYAQWAPKSKPHSTPRDLSDLITAVIFHCGESTYDACLKSLQEQTRTVRIATVRDAHPMTAAFDAGFDLCQTKWIALVDADMILYPRCIETLAGYTAADVGTIAGMLHDRVYGVIGNIKLMDAQTIKNQRFQHPPDDPYPERKAIYLLEGLGRKMLILHDKVLGEHNPYNTAYEAFRRFYGTYRKRGATARQAQEDFAAICRHARNESNAESAYYMMAGLVCAALADPSAARDYVADEEMKRMFQSVAQKWPPPKGGKRSF